jgi:predicted tellurium resistance membrane protein TerC
MKKENKKESLIAKFFRTQKVLLHLIAGAVVFQLLQLFFDSESLRFYELVLWYFGAGFIVNGFFEWFQMHFSGTNSQNKLMQKMYNLKIFSRNKKTKPSLFDCVITGIGSAVYSLIWYFFI